MVSAVPSTPNSSRGAERPAKAVKPSVMIYFHTRGWAWMRYTLNASGEAAATNFCSHSGSRNPRNSASRKIPAPRMVGEV